MSTFPKVKITCEDRFGKFKYYTFHTIYSVKLLEAMPDDFLMGLAEWDSSKLQLVYKQVGNINFCWVASTAAEILYNRGTIDYEKFSKLTTEDS